MDKVQKKLYVITRHKTRLRFWLDSLKAILKT
jgi:hypothetical protein